MFQSTVLEKELIKKLLAAGAVFLELWRQPSEKGGRPSRVGVDGEPVNLPPDVTWKRMMKLLPTGIYRLRARDKDGKAVGEVIIFEVLQMGEKASDSAGSESSNTQVKELQEANKGLLSALLAFAETMRQTVERLAQAQVEMTDKVLEATSSQPATSLVDQAKDVVEFLEVLPESGNQLETVLNSPVVMGAIHHIQKAVAKAAENSAERAAGWDSGPRRKPSRASVAARIAARMADETGTSAGPAQPRSK